MLVITKPFGEKLMKMKDKTRSFLFTALLFAILIGAVCAQGCNSNNSTNTAGQKVTLILGAYTTPREAYGKAIIPAFQKYWRDKTGQDVEFQESYQGSGAQARATATSE